MRRLLTGLAVCVASTTASAQQPPAATGSAAGPYYMVVVRKSQPVQGQPAQAPAVDFRDFSNHTTCERAMAAVRQIARSSLVSLACVPR